MYLLFYKLYKNCDKKHNANYPVNISGKKTEGGKYFPAEKCINP